MRRPEKPGMSRTVFKPNHGISGKPLILSETGFLTSLAWQG